MSSIANLATLTLGYAATIAFFIQYLPQMHQNYLRKSTEGFSIGAVVVKLLGASFMFMNYLLDVELSFVQLYALINLFQYAVLIGQASIYMPEAKHIALALLIPLPVFAFSVTFPETRAVTTGLKPLTQIVSHMLLLLECLRIRSVRGVSMVSQVLNLFGGLCGFAACVITPPMSSWTVWLYVNSIVQALTVFGLKGYFNWHNRSSVQCTPRDEKLCIGHPISSMHEVL